MLKTFEMNGTKMNIVSKAGILMLALFLLSVNCLLATNYYVATNGSNSNNGTSLTTPFLSIHYALSKSSAAGDTIFVRGGTYSYTSQVSISTSGTSESNRRVIWAYPGDDRPVWDFSGMAIASANQGVILKGSYWHIKGIRIKGAGDNGLQINGGAYNIIEFCDFFENRDGGFQMKNGAHDNKVINCDSYFNADYVAGSTTYTGGNADGFSPKLDCGTGNYYYGCRAWLNSDDGWDGYLDSNSDITTTIENCWTWKNGYLKDGSTTTSSMNGNGFKTGGGSSGTTYYQHNAILKNCLAFNNKSKGFDQNNNVGNMTFLNCTSKGNGGQNYSVTRALATGKILIVKNCISYDGSSKVSLSVSSIDTSNNSWKRPAFTSTIPSSNFVSIDTTGISGPRKADGSLPDVDFMHLAAGSALIDAGIDVGLTYYGALPDLGCFETKGNYVLTTKVSGTGTVSPSGANTYSAGTSVSITATPGTGYIFSNFSSNGVVVSSSNPYTLTMNASKTITANFSIRQHTITTSTSTGGSVTASSTVNYGTSVSITATPSKGYKFVNFTSGSVVLGTSNPISITVVSDTSVKANFEPIQYTLTTQTGSGLGTISPLGSYSYTYGSSVTLTATPGTDYRFLNFASKGITLSTTSPYTFTIESDTVITANFTSSAIILNTSVGTGSGSVNPSGANGYSKDEAVTITATPASGYRFVNFTSNGTILSSVNTLTITLTRDSSITANFELDQYTLTINTGSGNGSVSPSGSKAYPTGTQVTITATAATGYEFVNFTSNGDTISETNPYTVTVDANKTITANFEIPKFTLTTSVAGGEGTVTPSNVTKYTPGTVVSISATPADGYKFVSFTLGSAVLSRSTPMNLTMDANKVIVANFTSITAVAGLQESKMSCSCSRVGDIILIEVTSAVSAIIKAEVFDILGKKVWATEKKSSIIEIPVQRLSNSNILLPYSFGNTVLFG
jgi:hypothetical protein